MSDVIQPFPKDEIIQFPCVISIKAMGKNTLGFDNHIVQIVRRFYTDILESSVSLKRSKNNNYLSVTVKINAQNRKQADDIYQALTDDKRVLMAI